jgi:hypothetical protein
MDVTKRNDPQLDKYDSPPKKSSLLCGPKLDIEYVAMIHKVFQLGKHKSGIRKNDSVFSISNPLI